MLIISHPTGNQNVRAALRALQHKNLLSMFYTALNWRSGSRLSLMLPIKIRQQLERRSFDDIDSNRIRSVPWRAVVGLASKKFRITSLTRHETGWASEDAMFRTVDLKVAKDIKEQR